MGLAAASPTRVGLYINSITFSTSTAEEQNPYKYLLGTGVDGNGNYGKYVNSGGVTGNKIDELISYCVAYGYTYVILYDMSDQDFVGSGGANPAGASAEQFTAAGKVILENLITRFKIAGLDVAVVCDVYKSNQTTLRFDGTSQVRKIIDYNTSVADDPAKTVDIINFETEFWQYRQRVPKYFGQATTIGATNYPGQGSMNLYNSAGNGYIARGTGACGTPGVAATLIDSSIAKTDRRFIKATDGTGASEIRQIVYNVPTQTDVWQVDRPWTIVTNPCYVTWEVYDIVDSGNYCTDYETFLVRFTNCVNLINAQTTVMETEVYVGFPDLNYGQRQLSRLYDAGLTRLLITDYVRIPNWSYIDGNYANTPTGVNYRRVTDDLVGNLTSAKPFGTILSAESATKNNANGTNCNVNCQDNNFSGYFFEGRSHPSFTTGTNLFRPLDGPSGNPMVPGSGGECLCSLNTRFQPPNAGGGSPFTAKSIQDSWDYITQNPTPSGAGNPPAASTSFNERIAAASLNATNLTFDTIVVFMQSLIRDLVIDPPLSLTLNVTGTNSTCNNADDGTASVTVSGGVAPYTYSWSPGGATTPTIIGLAPGIYTVTVTDNIGTIDTGSYTVTEPAALDFSFTSTNPSCNGSNGTITVQNVTGGIGPFLVTQDMTNYFAVPHTFTGFAAGTFSFFVDDLGGSCGISKSRTLTNGAALTTTFSITNILCNGGSTGQVQVNIATPGTAPYTYTITRGPTVLGTVTTNATTHTFTGLTAGGVTINTVDVNGCGQTHISTITQTTPLVVNLSATSPTCYGGNDGEITATASGGVGPYNYNWSGSQTTATITGLSAGTYSVDVVDANGCLSTGNTATVTAGATSPIQITYDITNVTDFETADGAIDITGTYNGTGPYTYTWSDGPTTADRTGLAYGTYELTVVDDNGCSQIFRFKIVVDCGLPESAFFISLENLRCCAAKLGDKIVKALKQGDSDAAKCKLKQFELLNLVIDQLTTIEEPTADRCLDCDNIKQLIALGREICECCPCDETATPANYDPFNQSITPTDNA